MSKGNPQHAAVPRLRFPEFRDAGGWSQAPLGAALTERGQKSDGVSEVHSVSLSKGIVPQVEHMGRSFAASDTSHYNLVRPFDIVYTRSPLAIFKLGIVKQHKGENNAIVSPLYGVFEPRNQHLGLIVEAFFESPARSVRYLDPLAQKGAKNTIQLSNERFLSGSLYLPDDEDEQRKIADCLGSLDDLIAAEGRKLAALRDHKQGLMQQLFPREGETQPRLRFPEFRGLWKSKKLRSILVESRLGGNYENSEVNEGIPLIKMGNIGRGTINVSGMQYLPGESGYGKEDLLNNGDLLFNTRNTLDLVGKVAIWRNELPKAVYNSNLLRLRFNEELEQTNRFMNYVFNAVATIKRLRALATGTTSVAAIYDRDLKTLEVSYPALEEQRAIADCLSALDALIAAQAAKLDALRTHKRGLIQQLFPSAEDN